MNLIKFGQTLRKYELRLFSPLELQRVLGVSVVAARFLVHRYARRGMLRKLRNGLYCLADQPPSELAIANRLYEPSYLSFEFALSYHHMIPEATYVLTSATPRPTRVVASLGRTFEYHRLKRVAFTGYEPVRVGREVILIATPEKALVDTLYYVDLHEKSLNDRFDLRHLHRPRARSYARLFNRPSLVRLLKEVAR